MRRRRKAYSEYVRNKPYTYLYGRNKGRCGYYPEFCTAKEYLSPAAENGDRALDCLDLDFQMGTKGKLYKEIIGKEGVPTFLPRSKDGYAERFAVAEFLVIYSIHNQRKHPFWDEMGVGGETMMLPETLYHLTIKDDGENISLESESQDRIWHEAERRDIDPLTIAPMGGQIKQDGKVFQYAVMFISMPSSYVFEQPYVSREGKEYFSLEIPCY